MSFSAPGLGVPISKALLFGTWHIAVSTCTCWPHPRKHSPSIRSVASQSVRYPPAPRACCSPSTLVLWARRETRVHLLLSSHAFLGSVCCLLWLFPIKLPQRSALLPSLIWKRYWNSGWENVAQIFLVLLSPVIIRRDRAVAGCMQM